MTDGRAAVAQAGKAQTHTKQMAQCAMFTALLAVCSQIAIPLPLVPINLALLAVYLAAFLLDRRYALLSVALYLMLGAVGLPVFAGFQGGPAALFGKTGGYLLGYLCTAAIATVMRPWADTFARRCLACALGLLGCYVPGTLWFILATRMSLTVSLGYCVYPFLPGDVVKIALAALLVPKLQGALQRI
jgi:biotin transport system substrate-specific component